MKLCWITALGASGILALAGCSVAAEDDEFDDEKTATSVAALDVGTSSSELSDLSSLDPAKAASDVAASKTEGCRTRSVDPSNPNVVRVVLDKCSGRFGRHVVSGNLTVTFSSNADGSLHAETVTNDLTVDGRTFTRSVSADIKIDGNVRTVTRHSEKSGTKKNGDSFVQSGDEVVVMDKTTRCRTENGTGRAVVAGTRVITSTITNLQTCETTEGEDYCPTGAIQHVNETKGKTVLKTFDGSATAKIEISKPRGDKTTTWALACTPR